MPSQDPLAIDRKAPPFDKYRGISWLAPARSGRHSHEHARHQLYVGTGRDNPVRVLIKVTSRPGLVYERDLGNEIMTLNTINRDLPDSRHFPLAYEHGHLDDGRLYLIMSLFDEFPLATIVETEGMSDHLVAHLMAIIEASRAVAEIHRVGIFHVDLNPMNILHRTEKGRPIIRIVDFESSYDRSRHSTGVFYDPPTTPGYSAPELTHQPPDARADLFSLGAVLYTMIAGFGWTWESEVAAAVDADTELDADLKRIIRMSVHTNPEKRQASIDVFRSALAAYLEGIWPGRAW